MIITRISGGLGNQLFQYAVGRSISQKNNTCLILDTSAYGDAGAPDAQRHFTLGRFNISAEEMASLERHPAFLPDMMDHTAWGKARRVWFRLTERLKPVYKKKFIIEPAFSFCPEILRAGPDCYLSGNWQSEKYFRDIAIIIREEFTLKDTLSSQAAEWVTQIQDHEAVSIHIRRGDYVKNEKTNKLHGTTSLSYYQEAVQLVAQKTQTPHFFVFSDDIEWARSNLKLPYPMSFVSDPTIPDYEELIIMSRCKHHIIANSSFSWWGAWLNPRTNKIVVAPQRWFNVGTISTTDLIPESWVRL